MPRNRGTMPPRQVLAATGTAARAGVNARPTTRSSTRLSQQAPVQYAQPPLPSITKPSKRRAAKGDATEPLAKKRKVTKSGDQKSLIVVFKIPSASSSSDVPSKFDAVQDFGLPSPSTPAENKMSEPAIQAASGAVKSYQGNFAPPKTTRKRKQSSGACATRGSVFTEDPRPDPCGTPPAWAAVRFLINSLTVDLADLPSGAPKLMRELAVFSVYSGGWLCQRQVWLWILD